MRFVFAVLLFSLTLAGCAAGPTLAPSPLPGGGLATATALPALTISTVILGENPHPAGGLAVGLNVKSSIDTSEVRVTIKLPADVDLLTGREVWTGDLKAEQELFLNLTLSITSLAKADTIWIEAVGALPGGGTFSKTYALFVRPTADGMIEVSTTPFGN